jgi:hypothetical protein
MRLGESKRDALGVLSANRKLPRSGRSVTISRLVFTDDSREEGFAIALLMFVGAGEERFLRKDPGYAAYLQEVRWRWVPGIA